MSSMPTTSVDPSSLLGGEARPLERTDSKGGRFGSKGIGLFASIALTVNNISGAGMLEFPQMFQRAGILPSLISLFLVCVISTLFATTLADTVARIPHNKGFDRRVEFSDIFEHYVGRRTAMLTQAIFFLNLLSQNVAAIIACAQMFDSFAGTFYPGRSIALRLSPSPVSWVDWEPSQCGGADKGFAADATRIESSPEDIPCVPFECEGESALLISGGYAVTALLLAPLGLLTLEENMLQQKISFTALLVLSAQFLWTFCSEGLSAGSLPWVGNHWADALGVVIFNFAFCVTVPSWLNEKAPRVGVNQVFWTSTITATLLYTAVGALGAMAFPRAPENLLSVMLSAKVSVATRLCATLFGVVIIGLGVPIFSVIMRYNLVSGALCSEPWAHVWSSVLPWTTAWMLYQGSVMLKLLNWSGLILNGFIDFLMPGIVTLVSLYTAHRSMRRRREGGTSEQGRHTPPLSPLSPLSPSAGGPVKPFPPWLRPYYFEIVAAMVAFLLVLLPSAVWLEVYCADSKVCYPGPS
jgi:amino acid permease